MEAARFGFGSSASVSPAFKFDPTDDDIVGHYLLPRALGVPHPRFAHAVIEADPASLPPPDLLALHGHATSHHAFFLDVSKNGGHRVRDIKGGAGGKWHGQQGHYRIVTLLRPDGVELDIKYKRYDLTYKRFGEEDEEEDAKGKKRKRKNGGTPAGWVMHEYTIVSPPLHNTVLSRINRTAGKIKEDKNHHIYLATDQPGPSNYQGYFTYQEQPGPSHHHDIPYQELPGPSNHRDFPYQQQAGPSHHHDNPYHQQPGPSHHHDIPYQELPGPSHHRDFPYQQQAGPSHHHDNPYQEQPGPSHHYDDIPYQEQAEPGPSYYHHPIGTMCGGGGSDSSRADDGSWYRDNVSGMGDGFVSMLRAGDGFDADNTYNDHPLGMVCRRGEGLSDGSKAHDASFYSDNAGAMGNGYVNMIYAGEGFAAGDYHHPHDMMCGAGQGFSDGSQADDASSNGGGMGAGTTPTTATTCTTMNSTCQVAATQS